MTRSTILVVEDEAIVAADLAGKLLQLGYDVTGTVATGEDAIAITRGQRPDLILMDIRLAGATDGVEAADTIRRELGLPIIFLTAHSDHATLERAKLAEPFGYILKPFEERELATTIEMALYKHQAERKLRQAHDELEMRVEERTRELKEAEQVLREVNETLEQRVAERTAELSAANTLLRESRLAALNMMEDAVADRRTIEEASRDLEQEIAKRNEVQEALQLSNERLNVIAESADLLLRSDTPQQVVNELCRKVMAFLDCHAFFNFLVDEEAGRLRLNACAGIPDEEAKRIEWLDYGTAVCGCAARDSCRIVATDIYNTPDVRTDLVKSYGMQAYACHPLTIHGKVLGTLSFGTRTRTCFSDDDLSLMKAVTDQVAIAMQRKLAEEDLRRAHDELERRVAERTAALDATIKTLRLEIAEREKAEEALRQAQKMETVGRLAGGIAHDFNNLLTIISGFADQALEAPDMETAREALDHVITAGISAKELTHKLLTFSRQQVIQKRTINLGLVVDDMLRLLKRLIAENIEVSVSLPESEANIDADPVQIEQVLTNIVLNARDAMPSGGVMRLSVGIAEVENPGTAGLSVSPGRYAYIKVADTGIGIPPDNIERIFEPFFTTKELGKGTGLGLSIAYGIVQQHFGAIGVETSNGSGSIFTVFLPLVEKPAVQPDPIPASVLSEGEQTLLLVEDDPIVRLLLKVVLQKGGYTIIEAEDGDIALCLAEQEKFDLLVTDILMPNMNGMDLYAELKKRNPGLRAVFISGYSSDVVNETLPAGAKFLQKPVTKGILLETVKSLLDAA